MSRPQVLLALKTQFQDYDINSSKSLRVWLKLAPGRGAQDLPNPATPWRCLEGGFVTGWVTGQQLQGLAESDAVEDLDLAEPLRLERRPRRDSCGTGQAAPALAAAPAGARAPRGQSAVLGIIDTGLPFVHQGVLKPGARDRSTRLVALWDQDPAPDFGHLGLVPAGFGFGAVLNRKHMDAQRSRARGDETHTYQLAGYGAVKPRRTHGAHVLGLLAMGKPQVDTALGLGGKEYQPTLDADIVAVQLPRALLDSPSRGALCSAVLDGLLWMREVCGNRPLRVVVPYGSTLGPHDGSSLFEQALDAIVQASNGKLQVFLPAGNSFEMNLHAVLAQGAGAGPHTLRWRMPLASEASSLVELWAPAPLLERVDVVSPDGRLQFSLKPSRGGAGIAVDGSAHAQAAYAWVPAPDGNQQCCVLVRFPPTKVCDSKRQAGPSGDWLIQVQTAQHVGGDVHAYGSRGKGSFGSVNRGQQGRFVTAVESDWWLCTEGTISGIATGAQVGVVGAYVNGITRASVRAARRVKEAAGQAATARPGGVAASSAVGVLKPQACTYSSSGPARNGRKVRESFAGDQSAALRGVRSTGTRSAITWRMDGSSVAAPQAARIRKAAGTKDTPNPAAGELEPRIGVIQTPGLQDD